MRSLQFVNAPFESALGEGFSGGIVFQCAVAFALLREMLLKVKSKG